MNPETADTVLTVGKWASILDHIKNNRIEYLLALGLAHLLGLTAKAYGHVQGVCI